MRKSAEQVWRVLERCGFKQIPGWVFELEQLGFSRDEIREIQMREDMSVDDDKVIEQLCRDYYRHKYHEFRREKENREFMKDIYRDKLKEAREKYNEICRRNYEMTRENVPYEERKFMKELSGFNQLETEIKKHKTKLRMLSIVGDKEITPEMIAHAKTYRIGDIYEADKNYIICPFHDDRKPSMFIKNNFGYCFVCGAHADSIDLFMKKNGVTFREAIKSMQ